MLHATIECCRQIVTTSSQCLHLFAHKALVVHQRGNLYMYINFQRASLAKQTLLITLGALLWNKLARKHKNTTSLKVFAEQFKDKVRSQY